MNRTRSTAAACSYETAYEKLRSLEDAGILDSEKVANARGGFEPTNDCYRRLCLYIRTARLI